MKNFILCFLLLVFKFSNSQALLDSLSLDTMKGFTSVSEANAQPDKVIKLVLKKQKLTAFPDDLRKYKNLQWLDLSKNKITVIPSWISDFTSLQMLILSHNEIDTLNPQTGLLHHLKWFIMSRDPLVAIPDAIGGLTELRYLDLWGDNISFFSPELRKLTNLKLFYLQNILINQEEQNTIKGYLPNTTIFFSPACSCKN